MTRPDSTLHESSVDLPQDRGFYLIDGAILWLRPGSRDYTGLTPKERAIVSRRDWEARPPAPEPAPPPPAEPTGQRPTYVYFMQRGAAGSIKIGMSRNVNHRLSSMNTGSDVPIYLRGITPGSRDLEKRLHKEFAAYSVQGEWFEPNALLWMRIEELCAAYFFTRKTPI